MLHEAAVQEGYNNMTAFAGMSFGLWTDSGLTVPFSYTKTLVHQTDLSDNPQDFTLYLGSVVTARTLQTTVSPGVDYITLTPTDITAIWAASTSYTLGQRVRTVSNDGFIYKVTTAGTSGSTEPSWNAGGIGSTTTDNSVVWTKISSKHQPTEIILALASADLDTNTPGAALDVALTVNSTVPDAIPIYIRIVNAVTNTDNDTGSEELDIFINDVTETS